MVNAHRFAGEARGLPLIIGTLKLLPGCWEVRELLLVIWALKFLLGCCVDDIFLLVVYRIGGVCGGCCGVSQGQLACALERVGLFGQLLVWLRSEVRDVGADVMR